MDGASKGGRRPAPVFQNDVGNRYAATTIVAAITSTIRIYAVTVVLKKGDGGVRQPSMIKLAQILTVDKARRRKRLGALSPERMAQVDEAIRISLGLP